MSVSFLGVLDMDQGERRFDATRRGFFFDAAWQDENSAPSAYTI
jgi:hypothetical protein